MRVAGAPLTGNFFIQWQAANNAVATLAETRSGSEALPKVLAGLPKIQGELSRLSEEIDQLDPAAVTPEHIQVLYKDLTTSVIEPAHTCALALDPNRAHSTTLALHAMLSGGLAVPTHESAPEAAADLVVEEPVGGLVAGAHSVFHTEPTKVKMVRALILLDLLLRGPATRQDLYNRITEYAGVEPSTVDGGFKEHIDRLVRDGLIVQEENELLSLSHEGTDASQEAHKRLLTLLRLNGTDAERSQLSELNQRSGEIVPKRAYLDDEDRISLTRLLLLADLFWNGTSQRSESLARINETLGTTLQENSLRRHARILREQEHLFGGKKLRHGSQEVSPLELRPSGKPLVASGIGQMAIFLGEPLPAVTPPTPHPRRRDPMAGAGKKSAAPFPSELVMWSRSGRLSLRVMMLASEIALRGEASIKKLIRRTQQRLPHRLRTTNIREPLQEMDILEFLQRKRKGRLFIYSIHPAASARVDTTIESMRNFLQLGESTPEDVMENPELTALLSNARGGQTLLMLLNLLLHSPSDEQAMRQHFLDGLQIPIDHPSIDEAADYLEENGFMTTTPYSLTSQGEALARAAHQAFANFYADRTEEP